MPPPLYFLFILVSHTRQLVTPRLVRMALMMAALVCRMNFQVSFLFMLCLLFFFFLFFSGLF